MASTLYGFLDLVKNELRNAAIQNLGAAPSSPVKGQVYFDTSNNTLFFWDGTAWQSTKASGATVGYGASTAETAFGTAKSDGVATTVARSDHGHGNPVHDAAAHSAIPVSALAAATATLNLNSQLIANLAAPVSASDAANKAYVDNVAAGLTWKSSVQAATTANVGLSGTANIDGVTISVGYRILVKSQTSTTENGIYIAAAGAWSRASDADQPAELNGAAVWVQMGTVNADTAWVQTNEIGVIGASAVTWTQFSGAAQIIAGAGLTKTGNSLDVVAGDTSLTVAADSIAVNTAVIASQAFVTGLGYIKKFAAALTGTASPEVVTHNLNTRDITLTVLNGSSPYTAVDLDWDATTVNTATIRYSPNLGAGYRVVCLG